MARRGISSTITDLKRGVAANPQSRALNPHLFEADAACGSPASTPPGSKAPIAAKPKGKGKKRGEMNRTESEFALMLEKKCRNEELVSFDYEGITLRFGSLSYTADFVAIEDVHYGLPRPDEQKPCIRLVFYEVKGAHIFDAGLVRFKAARHNYPLFRFELWQKKAGEWRQLL